jgi:hypothetical protein
MASSRDRRPYAEVRLEKVSLDFAQGCNRLPPRNTRKDYIHFDEFEDVLSSLDLVALVVPVVNKHPSYWKWVLVAAHAGLQGAMVCALRDTSGITVLDKKSARETLKWLDTQHGNAPKERLADFKILLARCLRASCMDGQPLKLRPLQLDDLRTLHDEFRNKFSHFVPHGWSIEKAGLPRIVRAAVDATEILMNHPRLLTKFTGDKKRRLVQHAARIRKTLS